MPTPLNHLVEAERLLGCAVLAPAVHTLLTAQRGAWLLGNAAGDVQVVSGQSRAETHFYAVTPDLQVYTPERAAYECMLSAHPRLASPWDLEPAHAAFVAGYVAHLVWDELWLADVFLPFFGPQAGWGDRGQRHLVHNVLRTWLDRRDAARLDGSVAHELVRAEPAGWLPFVTDADLRAWRDGLVAQLLPGARLLTAQVFAGRMGVEAETIEGIVDSPVEMARHVFCRVPLRVLVDYRCRGLRRSAAAVNTYFGIRGTAA